MSFSYSGNPASSQKDEVRFLLGDTFKDKALMLDEEINYLISSEGGSLQAAIAGALQLAARFSKQADEKVGKISKNYSQRSSAYLKLVDELRKKITWSGGLTIYAGGISKADKSNNDSKSDRVKPIFTRETHNNELVGETDDHIRNC